jgi:putative MATE family efflux protein
MSSKKPPIRQLLREALAGVEQDFTRIPLKTGIFLLAVPMILEMMMESLFAVADIFFVSRLGKHAIATVGLTEAVVMIVYAVGIGISMAATAIIARRFGEKEYTEAGTAAFQLLLFGAGSSAVLGIIGAIYAPEILGLMGAEPEVIEMGSGYTRIIFAGNTAILLLFLINGAFRGAGQAHLAMRALWIANGINLVLDPLLIFGIGTWTGWGLEGAAIATTGGRSIGVIYQLYHLLNGKHRLVILRKNLAVKWETMKRIIIVSGGGMGQFLIDMCAWLVLTRVVADFGSDAVAGFTIAFRIMMFTLMPAWGLSGAASTLVGQNLGAKKLQRAELSVWLTARYNFIFLTAVMLLYLVFGGIIASWFGQEPAVTDIATSALRIIVLGYVFFGIGMVLVQSFNGAGDTRTPMWINIAVLWGIEIPLALVTAYTFGWGETGVFAAIAFAHSLHAVVSYLIFRQGRWKRVEV